MKHRYDPPPGLVAIGTHVEVELSDDLGGTERLSCDIVPDQAADFAAGFLGAGTPLGRAIMGLPVGSVIPYTAGDVVEVRILAVTPSQRLADHGAAEARETATREALTRSETEDIVRLALTVDVKWGDYDPEALEPDHGRP